MEGERRRDGNSNAELTVRDLGAEVMLMTVQYNVSVLMCATSKANDEGRGEDIRNGGSLKNKWRRTKKKQGGRREARRVPLRGPHKCPHVRRA